MNPSRSLASFAGLAAAIIVLQGFRALAAPGTVAFANSSSAQILNGYTGTPINATAGVRVALYWSPLGTNDFVQIGATASVGVPVAGVFVGGARTCGAATAGGTTGQFRLRAWSGGYPTYEQAFATPGLLIGQSAVFEVVTGDPLGDPPTPPNSLLSGGIQRVLLLTNSSTSPLTLVCATNKTIACGDPLKFDVVTTYGGCVPNPAVTVLETVTNGSCPWTVTRTWQATDGCSTSTCSQAIMVMDTTPPLLSCASDKVVACGTVWTFDPPAALDACSGANVTVTVVGTATNGVCPSAAIRTWLAIDGCGNSNFCSQTVTSAPLTIVVQPQSRTNLVGTPVAFNVVANSTLPVNYQWLFNGNPIGGETTDVLAFTVMRTNQAGGPGGYSVVLSNAYGAVTSAVAVLTTADNRGSEGLKFCDGRATAHLAGKTADGCTEWTDSWPADNTTGSGRTGTVTTSAGLWVKWDSANTWAAGSATYADQQLYNVYLDDGEASLVSGDNIGVSVTISNLAGWLMSKSALSYKLRCYASSDFPTFPTGRCQSVSLRFGAPNKTDGTNQLLNLPVLESIPIVNRGNGAYPFSGVVSGIRGYGDSSATNTADVITLTIPIRTGSTNRGTLAGLQLEYSSDAGQPPRFVAQPRSVSITNQCGQLLSLSAGAIGTPPLRYQWWKDGAILLGATAAQYLVPSMQANDAGSYTLLVTNWYGAATSSIATVTVLDTVPPTILCPTNLTVATTNPAGEYVNFAVVASDACAGILPVNTTPPSGSLFPVGTNTVVCWAADASGNTNSCSFMVEVIPAPSISTQPQGATVPLGSKVSFHVIASGASPLSYQWQFNGKDLADSVRLMGATTDQITLSKVVMADGGAYSVIVSNTAGCTKSESAMLLVLKGTPTLAWTAPAPIGYGTLLSSIQLTATSSVSGDWAYAPPAGTILAAGTNELSVTFTPADLSSYNPVTTGTTLVVTRAPLSVTVSNASRGYGQTNPPFNGAIVGLVNGDPVTAGYTCSAVATASPGAYAIELALNDPNGRLGNYTVTTNRGALTVSPADLTVTASDATRAYGATNPPFAVSYNGFVLDQDATLLLGLLSFSTPGTPDSPVGNYLVTPAGLTSPNYDISFVPGTLTVTNAPLVVQANDATRKVHQSNPLFNGTITGLVNGDEIAATFSSLADTNSPAGNYPIVPVLVDPYHLVTNYNPVLLNGTLTVSAMEVLPGYVELDHFTSFVAKLVVQGTVGATYRLEYTDDINQIGPWLPLTNIALPCSPYIFIDFGSSNSAKRFYRAVAQP